MLKKINIELFKKIFTFKTEINSHSEYLKKEIEKLFLIFLLS